MVWARKSESAKADEMDRAWRRSLRAAIAGDWATTETWLERIVEADSRDLDAYSALATLYRQQGSVGRSIRMHQNLLLRAELERRDRWDALLELARDFEAGGFKKRAAATYEELLGEQPRDALVLERLVSLLHDLGEISRALALVRRLRRREHEIGTRLEVQILLSRAQAQRDEGDHDGARQSIKRALRQDESCAAAWVVLGELHAERAKTTKALAAWKRAVLLDGAEAAGLYPRMAAGFASRGKPEDYDRFLSKILEDRPSDHVTQIALARARGARGDSQRAVEDLRRAIEIAPEQIELSAELGRQLLASGQDAEALKAYADLLGALEERAMPRLLEVEP